jgi:type IV secretory pathway VirJ component
MRIQRLIAVACACLVPAILVVSAGTAKPIHAAHATPAAHAAHTAPAHAAPANDETVAFAKFGTVTLYHPTPQPSRVVLFASGDGGWNAGVVDMARGLAAQDTLVIGFDVRHYLKAAQAGKEACFYPAGDFEALSQYVQKKLNFATYHLPVLVGYSSGATLAYATLVQSPPGTFQGGLGLGFCPDLLISKPMCKGSGLTSKPGPKGQGVIFDPAPGLTAPFTALQGEIDQVCDPPSTEKYVSGIPQGKVVMLPKVGHGYSVARNWMPQFIEAYEALQVQAQAQAPSPQSQAETPTPQSASVADLPLIEVPAQPDKGKEGDGRFAVLLTGDGGWAGLDREVSKGLAARGIPTVAWNSLQYYWKARTPESAADDLARILRHFSAAWAKRRPILIGYSLGADVMPAIVNRLPGDLRASIHRIVLLGPSETVSFQFHLSNWLGGTPKDAVETMPEIEKLDAAKLSCIAGKDDDSVCGLLEHKHGATLWLPGGHHFSGDYAAVMRAVLEAAGDGPVEAGL